MKIITEPSVHILAVPIFFPHPEYLVPDVANGTHDAGSILGSGLSLIAHAGKGCYDSYGKDGRSIEEHISGLITSKHGSVLEHCNVSLFLSGISRGCSHEIVRHRHFSYSQRSTRYTTEEGAAIVLDPYYAEQYYTYRDGHLIKNFLNGCENALEVYADAVMRLQKSEKAPINARDRRKWARGKARQLLPHALETRMTMTGNIRAWRHFLEERTSRHAEPEIRRLAQEIFYKLSALYPLLFEDYEAVEVDNFKELNTLYRKV